MVGPLQTSPCNKAQCIDQTTHPHLCNGLGIAQHKCLCSGGGSCRNANIRAFLYRTRLHLNTLPLVPPHALSPHTAEGCVDPVCLIYVTRLPRLITQYTAPLAQSLWETCDTVTYVRFKSVAMHDDKITLICLPSPHMINKIHLNISLLPLFHMWGISPV